MIYCYRMILCYQGARYAGFQIQKKSKVCTIQGELNRAIFKITKSHNIKTIASGRTDAGVHALGQVVKVQVPLGLPPEDFRKALNSLLPQDIYVEKLEWCDEGFHPIRDAKEKEYWYLFSYGRRKAPFLRSFLELYPFTLDIERMNDACQSFIGRHDFRNFYCLGTNVQKTVRTIVDARVISLNLNQCKEEVFKSIWSRDIYCFQVRGTGFLKQMVRLMMGALWEIGRGKYPESSIEDYLKNEKISKLGATAPPGGLYLKEVCF